MLRRNPAPLGLEGKEGRGSQICFLSSRTPQRHRVWRLLLSLSQSGPWHPVCRLQALHFPVCDLSRGRTRFLKLLPELWPRRTHQSHDGLVPISGRLPHRLRLPLPFAKHFLNVKNPEDLNHQFTQQMKILSTFTQ